MKALTLTQPWATLVALDAKRYETRGWSTGYRGPLAIHAGKGLGPVGGVRGLRELCAQEPFASTLAHFSYHDPADLPRGRVVAICELVAIVATDALIHPFDHGDVEAAAHEPAFGDYSPGRFAWALRDVRACLSEPVRGALGLWEWDRGRPPRCTCADFDGFADCPVHV